MPALPPVPVAVILLLLVLPVVLLYGPANGARYLGDDIVKGLGQGAGLLGAE